MKSQKHHERYRGIINSHGTACHTSSALQLIFHCFPNVRDKLLELAVATRDASTHAHDENNESKNNEARNISSDELPSSKKGIMIMQQEFVYQLAWFFYLLKHGRHVHTTKESSQRRQQGNYDEISPTADKCGTKSNSTDTRMSKTKRQLSSRQQAAIAEFMSSVASKRSIRKNLKDSNLSSSGTVNAAAETEKGKEINKNNDVDEKDWNAIKEEKWRALVTIMKEEEKLERLRQLKEQKQKERLEQETIKFKNSKEYRKSLHNVLGERTSEICVSPAFMRSSTPNEGRERHVDDDYFVNSYEKGANRSNRTLSGALSQSSPQRLTPPTSPARSSSHSHRPPNHNYHISTNDPIDPSEFYLYLTQYTTSLLESPSKGNKKGIIRIDTNNVADAATIFRCLVSTLEFSVTRELDRLNEVVDMQHVEEEGKFSKGESWLQPIRELLSQLKEAMQHEWNGALISRIVGTRVVASDEETPNDNSDATSSCTIIQRSKRNGNIERPIPVPFPLPVINQRSSNSTDPRSDSDKNGEGKNYFPSLVDSLHSITIEPNPIRGYDWTSMMKRGDVIEEKIVRHVAVVNRVEANPSFQAGQRATARTDRAVSIIHRDGINSETEDIVRTMDAMDMIETNFKGGIMGGGRREGGETDESSSTSKRETTLSILSDNGIAATNSTIYSTNSPIEKDAYYAAAVARLVARPQSRRGSFSSSRASSTSKSGNTSFRCRDSSSAIRHVASSSNSENPTSNVPVSPLLSPGADSFSGMEVGGIPAEAQVYSSSDQRITMTYVPSPTNSFASSTDSDSEEESSVDSQVSSVQDSDSTPSCIDDDDLGTVIPGDGSSETHSSAIETPSDIDELSLGSFTDDSLQENDLPVTKRAPPPVPMLGDETTHIPARETERPNAVPQVNTSIQRCAGYAPDSSQPGTKLALEAKSNAVEPSAESKTETSSYDPSSDTSSDSDSSSASSSDDDSTSTSESDSDASSSYTSNSSSGDSSATKSSDSSDEKESGVPFRSGVGDQQQHVVTWVTRKETRFRNPLPESLIFHLKRFEYSTRLGRVEKLCGLFHVPEEIDLSACCLEQRENLTCIDSAKNEGRICPCGDQFRLTGAIVHVDPLDDDEELAYGDVPEGHYVSYISQPYYSDKNEEIKYKWIEIDDDRVRSVHHYNSNIIAENGCASSVDSGSKSYGEGHTNDVRAALKIIDGCDTYVSSGRRLRAAAKKAPVSEKERRYAYLVVYSRICSCNNRKSNV